MNKWSVRPLKPGDNIRVDRGWYYHYGIYAGDGHAIHFCAENGDGLSAPETVTVRETGMEPFARGGFVEARNYTLTEQMKNRRPKQIVMYAKSRIGDGGYDILNNNCEHFANECVTGIASSETVDAVRNEMREKLDK